MEYQELLGLKDDTTTVTLFVAAASIVITSSILSASIMAKKGRSRVGGAFLGFFLAVVGVAVAILAHPSTEYAAEKLFDAQAKRDDQESDHSWEFMSAAILVDQSSPPEVVFELDGREVGRSELIPHPQT